MKTELNKYEMLNSLSLFSKNELIKQRAKLALKGEEIESGSFFRAVLSDDFDTAYKLADEDNKRALDAALTLHNQHNF